MQLICWGARGSAPVSGKEYLKYGGNTTCLELVCDNSQERIIFDLGSGAIPLGETLHKKDTRHLHIFLSHLHWDHIIGLPLFSPLFDPKYSITIWDHALLSLETELKKLFSPPFFPVPFTSLQAKIHFRELTEQPLTLDTLTITTIPLNHPNQGLGFCLQSHGQKVVFLTDNELLANHEGNPGYSSFVSFVQQADILIHDAEYTAEEYQHTRDWGHSTFEQAIQLAKDAQVRKLAFFHHNRFRNDDALDQLVNQYSKELPDSITCLALAQGQSVEL